MTLRELHENTDTLVREAVRLGGLVVTDRGTPIARIEPASRPATDKPFKRRRILPAYQESIRSFSMPERFKAARTAHRSFKKTATTAELLLDIFRRSIHWEATAKVRRT